MDVQFDEGSQPVRTAPHTQASGLVGLVLSAGLADDAKGAQRVLLVIACLAIVLSIVLYIVITPNAEPLSEAEFQRNLELMKQPLPTRR